MKRVIIVLISIGVILGAYFGITAASYLVGALVGGGVWDNVTNIIFHVLLFVMVTATLLTMAERKWSAFIQDRIGPNRASIEWGFLDKVKLGGLLHIPADVLKMLWKEDFIPEAARGNKFLYYLAPMLAFAPVFVLFAIVPVAPSVMVNGVMVDGFVSNPNFGLLYVFAIASLAVYGTSLAGWASNNKFALLGGVRAASQMISYEVALGLGLVGIMMTFSTVRLLDITNAQGQYIWQFGGMDFGLPAWGIFLQPLGFLLFFAAAFAETKRAPFDAPEGDSEIIGYFVEYSGMRFGLFMVSEFVEIVVLGAITTAVFFGGWHLPFGETALYNALWGPGQLFAGADWLWAAFLGMVFWFKVVIWIYLQLAIRWTFPRFRYDQIQTLGWKILLPLGLANVFITGALVLWDPSLQALTIFGLLILLAIVGMTTLGGAKAEEAHGHGGGHGGHGADAHGAHGAHGAHAAAGAHATTAGH